MVKEIMKEYHHENKQKTHLLSKDMLKKILDHLNKEKNQGGNMRNSRQVEGQTVES